MDIIDLTRQLGAAIQADPTYIAYALAKEQNDKDEALQALIGEFNLQRMSLNQELQKEEAEKSQSKIESLNTSLQELYGKIMENESMSRFNDAKTALDEVVSRVNSILLMCINGEDPATCEPSNCSGSCSTCGGCH